MNLKLIAIPIALFSLLSFLNNKKENERYVLLKNENNKSIISISQIPGEKIKKLENIDGYSFESNKELKEGSTINGMTLYKPKKFKVGFLSGCEKKEVESPDDNIFDNPCEGIENCIYCEENDPKLECKDDFISPIVDTPKDEETGSKEVIPWGIEKVKALEAQKIYNGKDAVVCVVDTGIDKNHEDIKDKIIGGKSFVENNSDFQDDNGHGTHVAGTISAIKNGRGVVGVSQAKIFASKVLDKEGVGWGDWIAEGIFECIKQKADVINLSLGSPFEGGEDKLITDAVKKAADKNIIVVIAAGNESGKVGWPGAFNYKNVYTVSAIDEKNNLAYFSNSGETVDFTAPGEGVLSLKSGGGYEKLDGTSMAAPHVTGLFALIHKKNNKTIKTIDLKLSKDKQGAGLIDALETVKQN
jgi:subtilisin family serine protease